MKKQSNKMTLKIMSIVILQLMIITTGCRDSSNKLTKSASPVQVEVTHGTTGTDISIHEAALNGQLNLVVELAAKVTSIDTTDKEGRTALMYASYNGHYDIVKYLVQKGASVNLQDNYGRSALMMASSGPFPAVVKFLLDHQANPNLADREEHYTALMYAAAEGQIDVVKVLLAYRADPSLKDSDGDDALTFARNNGHKEVAALLESIKK